MVDVDTNFDRIRRGVWVGPNAAKPYVEWNDLSRVLTDLLQWARLPESREKFDEVMYDSLKLLLKAANADVKNKVENLSKLTQRDVDTVTVTIIATANIIRLLRNSVVNLPRNQFLQVKTGVLDCILDSVYFYHDVGTKCHRVKHKIPYVLTYTPLCVEVIRAALQLTSNLCVGNHAVQGAVWTRLYPSMFGTLLSSIDKQVKNYVCSILFHCTAWNGSSALEDMLNGDEGKEMIRTSIGLCQVPNSLEWAQLFVEGLICVERFIDVYEICRNDNLVFTLLEVLSEKVKTPPSSSKKQLFGELESAVPVTTFLFLAKLLARNRQHLVDLATGEDIPEGEVTVRILRILASVTGLFQHYTRITNNTPFLECVVKILNEINSKQPIKFDQPKGEVAPDGSFAIRRELIRVITNMSCKNKDHQDKVRLLGGVHTVLNHCVVDQQNPYLPQWSIVALRMLMENNPENQDIIRGLQSQNIVNNEDMKKLGIEVAKMDGDKPRVAVVHPESEK